MEWHLQRERLRTFTGFESRLWCQIPQALLLHFPSWMPLSSISSGLAISQAYLFPTAQVPQAVPAFQHALPFCAFSKAHPSHLCPGTKTPFLVSTISLRSFGGRTMTSCSPAVLAPAACPGAGAARGAEAFPSIPPCLVLWMPAPWGHTSAGKPFLKTFPAQTYQPRSWYGFASAEWEKH